MQIENAIIVCGKIRAGKSHFAEQIKQLSPVCVASFGDYLKSYAEERGLSTSRSYLQDLGENMIDTDPFTFLTNVIQFSCTNEFTVVFEGVRHLAILQAIKASASAAQSVYLDIPEGIRLERYLMSGKSIDGSPTVEEFYERSNHPVERDVENLIPISDYVVHDDAEIAECIKELSQFFHWKN
jgi:cytidylate kinase